MIISDTVKTSATAALCILFMVGWYMRIYWRDKNEFKNFGKRNYTICTTVKVDRGKGKYLTYIFSVNNIIYGAKTVYSKTTYNYPNGTYYVVYSAANPKLNIFLPDYPINQKFNPDTINNDYFLHQLKEMAACRTQDEWGSSWEKLFIP